MSGALFNLTDRSVPSSNLFAKMVFWIHTELALYWFAEWIRFVQKTLLCSLMKTGFNGHKDCFRLIY